MSRTAIRSLRRVTRATPAFEDRADAGRKLSVFLDLEPRPGCAVLALPRGGVPVAAPLARALRGPLAPVFVRKLPLPGSPEMGFGAVALDGSVQLNEAVVRAFGVSPGTVESQTASVLREVRRRAEAYGGGGPLPVAGRRVFLVDDGLATGYTMMAAARMVRNRDPESLHLAVPVAPARSVDAVADLFDAVSVLYVQEEGSFAVASFYERFPDLADAEVQAILETG